MSKKMRMISMAPMMDCTDRHDRFFLRLISKNIFLYSEMIATGAILNGDKKKILEFSEFEKPVALQLGGSNLNELSECCKIVEDFGYDEINLNLGCPSKKVQKNKFGACLIKEPDLVADCLSKMIHSTKLPVTAKTRIGFDDVENFEYLNFFIEKIKKTGVKTIILHARKAVLKGLSPKENLRIPKLNYPMVYDIKKANPEIEIIINGAITNTKDIKQHLNKVDGVMIGRAIYQSPYFLADIEREIFNNNNILSREEIVEELIKYVDKEVQKGTRVNQIMRHTVGLYHGQKGARKWKRYLSDNMMARDSDFQKVKHILEVVQNNEKLALVN